MRLPGLISMLITVLLFSCTIIEDSDIISMDQYGDLQLQSIEILQQKGGNISGPGSAYNSESKSVTATLSKVDDINITSPFGNITRFVKMDLPTVSDLVFEFRSKPNSAVTLEQYFLSDGRPYSFEVLKSSASLEFYSFEYDNSKRLIKILFYLGEGNIISDDTLIYDNTGTDITRIVRRSLDPLKAGTITIQYLEGGTTNSIRDFKPGFQIYSYSKSDAPSGGACPPIPCSEFRRSDDTQTGNWPMKIVTSFDITGTTKKLGEVTFEGFGGTRFYFHPLMILTNDFSLGKELMTIYMVDWWNPEAGDPGGMSQLKYKFSYGL